MMSSLDSMLSHFFALLEAWEFSRASYVAERISSRGSSRRISLALQHLVTCESLYLSMRFLDSRNAGLERRIDECASELEACLAALSSTAEAADALYAPADSALCGALQQLVACHFPPADEGGGRAAVSGAHVGAMEETVLLLRHVRKPMLHVYISLAGGALSPDGCGRLAEHVGAIREAHARRPSGALPRGVRGATLVELGAAQQLLLAHATLPLLRPREALLALAISHTELGRLRTAERGEAHERALLVATNASSLGSGLGSRTGPQVASSKASSEPPLFRFLRAFCAALVAKAALYFQRLFEPAKLHAALAAEPSAYARRLAAFAQSSAPLMAALLFHPKGLHVRTAAGGGVYTCHEAEARLWGAGGGGGGGGEGAPWPVLCLEPAGAPLPQLWPTLKRLMAERQTLLHLSDAYVPPLAVPAVGECTFWLATYDPRVVLVLAFAGRRRANDRAVLEFLRAFADLRGLPARAALEARRE